MENLKNKRLVFGIIAVVLAVVVGVAWLVASAVVRSTPVSADVAGAVASSESTSATPTVVSSPSAEPSTPAPTVSSLPPVQTFTPNPDRTFVQSVRESRVENGIVNLGSKSDVRAFDYPRGVDTADLIGKAYGFVAKEASFQENQCAMYGDDGTMVCTTTKGFGIVTDTSGTIYGVVRTGSTPFTDAQEDRLLSNNFISVIYELDGQQWAGYYHNEL